MDDRRICKWESCEQTISDPMEGSYCWDHRDSFWELVKDLSVEDVLQSGQRTDETHDWYFVKDVVKLIGFTARAVINMLEDGRIRGIKPGGGLTSKWYIYPSAFEHLKALMQPQGGNEANAAPALSLEAQSTLLFKLPYVEGRSQLHDIIRSLPYEYTYTRELRELIKGAEHSFQILSWGAEIIIESWSTHQPSNSIFATLLHAMADRWNPTKNVLRKLELLSIASLGDVTQLEVVEPLVNALGAQELTTAYRNFLLTEFYTPSLREANVQRAEKYYRSQQAQISAYARHLSELHRPGLLRANNITRLLHLLATASTLRPQIQDSILRLLQENVAALRDCGEDELATAVEEEKKSLGVPRDF